MADKLITLTFGNTDPVVEFRADAVAVGVPFSWAGGHLYRLEGVPFHFASSIALWADCCRKRA
jgi:hypothetical protein